jgi:hypothetical protein
MKGWFKYITCPTGWDINESLVYVTVHTCTRQLTAAPNHQFIVRCGHCWSKRIYLV